MTLVKLIFALLGATLLQAVAAVQHPMSLNATHPPCPYGGTHNPLTATCHRTCIDYQTSATSHSLCPQDCSYPDTTIDGDVAENPVLCTLPTAQNGLEELNCTPTPEKTKKMKDVEYERLMKEAAGKVGWICWRKFGGKDGLYRKQGPVCSIEYRKCTLPTTHTSLLSRIGRVTSKVEEEESCASSELCIRDPRLSLSLQKPSGLTGICVAASQHCTGASWDECGDLSTCVSLPKCHGISATCPGTCVRLLGPNWGTVNGSEISRRALQKTLC
jgi:hypothetical protein